MKPVQLLPPKTRGPASMPGTQTIGIIAGVAVAVFGVGGYFAMSHVSNIKAETTNIDRDAQELTNQANAIDQKIQEAGKKDDSSALASNREQKVIEAVSKRQDLSRLSTDVASVRPSQVWFSTLSIAPASADGSATPTGEASPTVMVTVDGYGLTSVSIQEFVVRLKALKSLSNVTLVSWVPGTKAHKFSISAESNSGGVAGSNNLASNSSDSTASKLALTPYPEGSKKSTAKAKAAAPVLTAFQKLNNETASYGGGS